MQFNRVKFCPSGGNRTHGGGLGYLIRLKVWTVRLATDTLGY